MTDTQPSAEEAAEQPLPTFEEPIPQEASIEQLEEEGRREVESALEGVLQSTTVPEARTGGAPAWVKLPAGLSFPRGRALYFLRFRAEWTDTPAKGERQCICWPISVGDKKLAAQRAMSDANRITEEMCMRFVRVVDGHVVDHSGAASPGNLDVWWNEVGEKVRAQIMRIFMRAHVLDAGAQRDFLENCIAVRIPG